jgi:outer membrane lipoprotein SlyB
MNSIITRVALTFMVAFSVLLIGCASYRDLPIRYGTIKTADATQKKVFIPSGKGAAVGAATGGVVGHQTGKGSGKTAMTILGAGTGALLGAAMGGEEKMVPATIAQVADDQTGQTFMVTLDGTWSVGMKLQYSISDDGKFIQR